MDEPAHRKNKMTPDPSSLSSGRYDSQTLGELLKQLHVADEHFHTARGHVEQLLGWQDYDHPDHDQVEHELRAANQELQTVTAKINALLRQG